jgi:hypothetical protein
LGPLVIQHNTCCLDGTEPIQAWGLQKCKLISQHLKNQETEGAMFLGWDKD